MRKFILSISFMLFTVGIVSAKVKIPIGKVDKLEIVADLPNTPDYALEEDSNDYLDLARLHQEFNIAWILPVWITEEPKLVLAKDGSDEYYEISDEQIDEVLKNNNLNKDDLLSLGFYTRYGGKAVIILLLVFIFWGFFDKEEEKDIKPTNV